MLPRVDRTRLIACHNGLQEEEEEEEEEEEPEEDLDRSSQSQPAKSESPRAFVTGSRLPQFIEESTFVILISCLHAGTSNQICVHQ
jgi:hypothetical protein